MRVWQPLILGQQSVQRWQCLRYAQQQQVEVNEDEQQLHMVLC